MDKLPHMKGINLQLSTPKVVQKEMSPKPCVELYRKQSPCDTLARILATGSVNEVVRDTLDAS